LRRTTTIAVAAVLGITTRAAVADVSGYGFFGLGTYRLHNTFACPYLASPDNDPNNHGCYGTEPINFVSGQHMALDGGGGVRFSRYFAVEAFFSLMPGGSNTVHPEQSAPVVLDSRITNLIDIQPRLRGDLPITSTVSLYATAGIGWKYAIREVDENLLMRGQCQTWNDPHDHNKGCETYYPPTPAYGNVTDRTTLYFPVSAGVDWEFSDDTSVRVNYQPPQGRGFSFHRLSFEVSMQFHD
jgi:opacity protein-like surface antigen